MLLVCLNTRGSTQEAIHASRRVRGEHPRRGPGHRRRAVRLAARRRSSRASTCSAGRAACRCSPTRWPTASAGSARTSLAGTHRVFLADVTRAVAREGSPLTYFRGKFGRFEVEQDRIVYGELRSRILSRSFSLEDSLDVGTLAKELDVLPATVYHAVTKLVADGLLARDPERGYVVKPVTPESSEQAFDARCAMELGVAATTVGQVPPDRIAVLRELMEETVPLVAGGPLRRHRGLHPAQRGLPQRARRPGRQPDPGRRLPAARRRGPDGLPAARRARRPGRRSSTTTEPSSTPTSEEACSTPWR